MTKEVKMLIKRMVLKGFILLIICSLVLVLASKRYSNGLSFFVGGFLSILDFIMICLFVSSLVHEKSKLFFLILQSVKYAVFSLILYIIITKTNLNLMLMTIGFLILPLIPLTEVTKLKTD
ncbi:MAG: ATP synthase subunit I [candidate division WOR-3 bacterium]